MSKSKILVLISILISLMLISCGNNAKETNEQVIPTEAVISTPTPTVFVNPDLKECKTQLTINGNTVQAYYKDSEIFAKLSEIADALDVAVKHETEEFIFDWRLSQVSLTEDDGLLCDDGNNLYVPVEKFCNELNIAYWIDEEYDHIYCTPGAGQWELPEGYNVAVMMYHQVGDEPKGLNNTIVHTDDMEAQIKYLLDNGYTPIWFEDLWNVANIDKPVILVFDDGMWDNYTELFPLVKKYGIKVTVAPYKENIYIQKYMLTEDQIKEMSDSGLVAIESHTCTHPYLSQIGKEEQYDECWNSRVWLTRVTGKQPAVLVYPYGDTTTYVTDLINEEHMYRFGVKMLGFRSYNTSDDPAEVYRFFPEVDTDIYTYASWLQNTFPEQ